MTTANLKIKTDNKYRELVTFDELPAKEKLFFDYVRDSEKLSPRFFKYRGTWYDGYDFLAAPKDLSDLGWHGYQLGTYFSGVVIKYDKNMESVIVGAFYYASE